MRNISAYTFKIIITSTLGSLTYGYASGVAGTITGQPSFVDYFDYNSDDGKTADTFNGLLSGGGLIGVFLGGWLAEKYGRKRAIFTSCCFSTVGAVLMCASVHIAMLYVSRFIMGVGIGSIVMLIPLWQTEIAPAESRGLLVGIHGTMNIAGYSICNWIDVGFYFCADKKANWRVPLAFQMLWPILLGIVVWYVPESPRWLIENEKLAEARGVMGHLRPDIDDERFKLMVAQIANENQHTSWKSLFTVPSYRKRLFVGFLVMIGGQATGTLVVTNYGPTIYGNLGFSSLDQLLLSAGYITSGIFLNFGCALLLDVVGRKTLLMTGFFGSGCVAMSLEAAMVALYSGSSNIQGNDAAVFFIFFHILFYGGTTDATTYVYATEVWPTHIRAKGTALCTSGLFIGILAFTTGVQSAFNSIGWRYYLVFVCLSFVNFWLVFFFLPETKGLSLEEIGALFGEDIGDVGADLMEISITDKKLAAVEVTEIDSA